MSHQPRGTPVVAGAAWPQPPAARRAAPSTAAPPPCREEADFKQAVNDWICRANRMIRLEDDLYEVAAAADFQPASPAVASRLAATWQNYLAIETDPICEEQRHGHGVDAAALREAAGRLIEKHQACLAQVAKWVAGSDDADHVLEALMLLKAHCMSLTREVRKDLAKSGWCQALLGHPTFVLQPWVDDLQGTRQAAPSQ